jgi:tetratricopeptide (TPR) repeat protein
MGLPPEPETLALLEEARDALGDRDPALRSRLLSKLTGTAPYMLSMRQRDALSREALDLARASGDVTALRDALSARHWACLGPDRLEERVAVGEELVSLGARLGDALMVFTGQEALFGVNLLRGDAAGADRALGECRRLADALRYRFVLFQARFFEGARASCAGDLDGAERIFAEALELGRGRVPYAQVTYDAHVLWLRFQRGERKELGASLPVLEGLAQQWKGAENVARATIALVALDEGREDDARRLLDEIARPGLAALERDEHFLLTTAIVSDLILWLGDRTRAAELYGALLPYAHLFAFHDLLRTFAGSVSGELGELAHALGRLDDSVAHYEAALAHERRVGARAAAVSSQFGLARALRARGGPGDAERAGALLAEAEASAALLGIAWRDRFRSLDP